MGGSPPVSLEVDKDITCVSVELDEKAGGKEFVCRVCNLRDKLCTGERTEMFAPARHLNIGIFNAPVSVA